MGNLWANGDYIYAATYSGVKIYDRLSEEMLNFVALGGTNAVWANDSHLYVATVSGIYRCDVTTVTGTLSHEVYKQVPEVSSNEVMYVHGAGNYLCASTAVGVHRYNLSTGETVSFLDGNPEKCFQVSDGGFYYYINPEFKVEALAANFCEWDYARTIDFDAPASVSGLGVTVEIPLDTPYNIYQYSNTGTKNIRLLNFTGSSLVELPSFWSSGFSGYNIGGNFAGTCTIMAWVRPSSVDGTQRFVFSDSTDNEGILSFYNNKIYCFWAEGLGITYNTSVKTSKWYHVAMWHKNEPESNLFRLKLYVDGVLVGEQTRSMSGLPNYYGPDGQVRIGRYFKGIVYDVQIYDYSMADSEIKAASCGILRDDKEGLLSHIKLDEGEGTSLYDACRDKTVTASAASWAEVSCVTSDLLFVREDGSLADHKILRWDFSEYPESPVVQIDIDAGVEKVFMLYGNRYGYEQREFSPLLLNTSELEVSSQNCEFGWPSRYPQLFDQCKLYAVYPDLTRYIYYGGVQNFINAYQINDIFVSESTSMHSPGNTLFLATSWGSTVIEELRGAEEDSRYACYLISS